MGLLRRKKSSDDKVSEDKEKNQKKSASAKTSERRRKKEPSKPWGKKERQLVGGVFLITIIISAGLAASAREWKLPGVPRLKAPALDFFEGETIVITSDDIEGTEGQTKSSEEVINSFRNATVDLSGVYGLYVIDLNSGYSYGTGENEIFEAASLIKLPVMIAMYMQEENGKIDLDMEYTLKESDKITGSGSLSSEPDGTVLTYQDLIKYMGQESDNTAFGIAKRILGDDVILKTINEIGMSNTSLVKNETTPYEIGLLFRKIWNGKLINDDNSKELLNYLTDTIYESWLSAGISDGLKVSHKYGREVHVVNDAGIVYADDPYVVVVLSKGVVEREADNIFPKLSKIVFDGQGEQ